MRQLTTFRLYLLGVSLLFAGYVALEYHRPQAPNWTPTYVNKDKIPYGTFVLYDQLPRLLGTDSVEAVRLPVYNQLTGLGPAEVQSSATPRHPAAPNHKAESNAAKPAAPPITAEGETADSANRRATAATNADTTSENAPVRTVHANYLFVSQEVILSKPDAQALLRFVARGNDAFFAVQHFGNGRNLLRDSLGFDVREAPATTRRGRAGLPQIDSVDLRFTHPALARVRLRLPGTAVDQRLLVKAGRRGHTLATDAQGRAVFISLNYGRGHVYLCTAPAAFANYYLLRPGGAAFAAAALAYLPARRTWWDEYQKQGPAGEQSLLRVVFAHEALRLAYYLCLVGGLLFVLVEARRRQRIIPTLKPLPNTTLLFTRTVASLYRQGSSHALIAEKKVGLFMDYLRTRFREANPDFADADFRERLAQKSGLPRPRVDELLRLVNFARTAPRMTDQQLLQLSKAMADFKHEASR